mgnify:CR=1 FL=1
MSKIYDNITDLIGATPIVKLRQVDEDSADVYVKLEAFNPGGSVKDRIALNMIRAAEADGSLKPGGTIVEPTSGNTGIGLAFVGAALGYKVIIVLPETFSIERRRLIQAYGAELVLTPAAGGMGAALVGLLGAELKPGIQIVIEALKLADEVADADLVITGEGRIDSQTIHGKTPIGVARCAKQFGKPVIGIAGCLTDDCGVVHDHGIDAVFAVVNRAMSLPEAIATATTNLQLTARNVAALYLLRR